VLESDEEMMLNREESGMRPIGKNGGSGYEHLDA
jgi:hypothetical protein